MLPLTTSPIAKESFSTLLIVLVCKLSRPGAVAFPMAASKAGNPLDDFDLVNYTFFRDDPQVVAVFGSPFLRDPERINPLPNGGPPATWWPTAARPAPWRTDPSQPPGPYPGGVNAPYTYPDANNLFLAAVRADGSVLLPSFHRPWLGMDTMDPANPAFWKWKSNTDQSSGSGQGRPMPWLKYQTLRPRPADHPDFPPPEDGGDVKNLVGSPGTLIPGTSPPQFWANDSIWIDLGFPVLTDAQGLRYKPLFAPLIVDLDNRVNLNVTGNARGAGGSHASQQGWGPWVMNPGHVLDHPANESANLLVGTAGQAGRYGANQQPGAGGFAPGLGTVPHFYARADFDAVNESGAGVATGGLQLPGPGSFSCFPSFPPGYGDGSAPERWNHPLGYNYFRPSGDDSFFGWANLEAPLRYGDTGSQALASHLFRLARGNFGDTSSPSAAQAAARRRNLVTTHSFDLDRAGVAPGIWDPGQQPYASTSGPSPTGLGDTSFPWLSRRYGNTFPKGGSPNVPPGSEFQAPGLAPTDPQVDWRCRIGGVPRLDVNRPLPAFPPPDPVTGVLDFTNPATLRQFQAAQTARQGLAPTGLIFHMSRCGSTLVSQMLAALPQNVVLAEAGPLDGVLRAQLWAPDVTDGQRVAWLRGLVSALGQARNPEEMHLFIKLDSWHTLELPLIRRVFPGVPWVFLYRNPVEVVVSHVRQRGAQMVPGVLDPASIGLDLAAAGQMGAEEYIARVLARICERALDAHLKTGGRMLVNYEQLPAAITSEVANFFGMDWSAEEKEHMTAAARFNAKNPCLFFAPDSAEKQQQGTDRIRQVADAWVRPVYERLEALRRARG
jgi:hypothetical protein